MIISVNVGRHAAPVSRTPRPAASGVSLYRPCHRAGLPRTSDVKLPGWWTS